MKFPAIIIAMSLLTHLLFFGEPREVVFDEVYMGDFISSYSQSRSYFDIHPPLAKLMSHYIGRVVGISYENIDFSLIGNGISGEIIYLRILPLIAGILLPLIVYFICRRLGISVIASFVVGILMCFENSLIVQSRYILFDSTLLFFGFSSILMYLFYIKDENKRSFILYSAILSACAFSIKWTGLAYPLLIILYEIIRTRDIRKITSFAGTYIFIGIIIYASAFALHFSFTPIDGESIVGRFIELNKTMYTSNKYLTATHQYGSMWYTWPLMIRPVFYWQDTETHRYIYLLGNILIYVLGTISMMLVLLYSTIFDRKNKISLFILIGFFVNFIPYAFIGRVMFLYHYEAALVFSIIGIGFIIDKIKTNNAKLIVSIVIVSLSIVLFIYFSPLTYGTFLTDQEIGSRMWLSSWR